MRHFELTACNSAQIDHADVMVFARTDGGEQPFNFYFHSRLFEEFTYNGVPRLLTVLQPTCGEAPFKLAIGMFEKKHPSLLIENDRRHRRAKSGAHKPGAPEMHPERHGAPDT